MKVAVQVRSGAATDVGRRRTLNEDASLSAWPVYMVADGMGGHDGGEVASRMAMDAMRTLSGKVNPSIDVVREVLDSGRAAIDAFSEDREKGAGTTVSGVVLTAVQDAPHWLTVNIGDSRTYRYAAGQLEQITVDHSLVQELIDSGKLSPEQAESDSRRNVVTRAMGAGSHERIDYWVHPASAGDRMLICTDGLCRELDDGRIADILAAEPEPQAAADRLVQAAVEQGGRDNITVIVVDAAFVDDDDDIDADTTPRETVGGRR